MVRPKYAKPDDNNNVVRDAVLLLCGGGVRLKDSNGRPDPRAVAGSYRGYPVVFLNISQHGGASVDWIGAVGEIAVAIEVKGEGQEEDLTPGEREFLNAWPGLTAVCTSAEQVLAVFDEAITEMEGVCNGR